jgi:hypothetical protein
MKSIICNHFQRIAMLVTTTSMLCSVYLTPTLSAQDSSTTLLVGNPSAIEPVKHNLLTPSDSPAFSTTQIFTRQLDTAGTDIPSIIPDRSIHPSRGFLIPIRKQQGPSFKQKISSLFISTCFSAASDIYESKQSSYHRDPPKKRRAKKTKRADQQDTREKDRSSK